MQLADTMDSAQVTSALLAGRVREFYETLDLQSLATIQSLYAGDICFEDPIRGLQGLRALEDHFKHLLQNSDQCRFKFHRSVVNDEGMFFSWTMLLRHKAIKHGQLIRVEGSSYLKHRNGKVYYHRDYFDLGALVYENVPLLGSLIKLIKNRMSQ